MRLKLDFQGATGAKNLRWVAGYELMDMQIGSVPIDKLNKGKDPEDMLPNVPNLFDNYVNWGIINQNEKDGGWHNSINWVLYMTLVIMKLVNERYLVWLVILTHLQNFTFGKIALTHRQYFTIIPNDFLCLPTCLSSKCLWKITILYATIHGLFLYAFIKYRWFRWQ